MSASLFDIFYEEKEYTPEKRFHIYATDKNNYYLDDIYSTNDRARLIKMIKNMGLGISHKKWAKKYTDIIELTITDGDSNWSNSIGLNIHINEKKIYNDKNKIWNEKIVFHRK